MHRVHISSATLLQTLTSFSRNTWLLYIKFLNGILLFHNIYWEYLSMPLIPFYSIHFNKFKFFFIIWMFYKLFTQSPSVKQLDCLQMLLLWYSLETFKSKGQHPWRLGLQQGIQWPKSQVGIWGTVQKMDYKREEFLSEKIVFLSDITQTTVGILEFLRALLLA